MSNYYGFKNKVFLWLRTCFLFCYEISFIVSLSDVKQADIIDVLTLHPGIWNDILSINNYIYFDNMVSQTLTLQSFNLIKLIPLIPKSRFRTCICPFLMIFFLQKITIKVTILILNF